MAETTAELGAEPRADQTEQPTQPAGAGGRDSKPRKRAKRKHPSGAEKRAAAGEMRGAALKARSKVLETKLGELLTFPAVPSAMVVRDPLTQAYMIEHFTRSGPRTAAALVEASESNPQLRELLERITAGGSMFTVVLAIVAYAAPPAMWAFGMREQAARMTQATTMTEDELRMMQAAAEEAAANAAAAQTASAASAENGAETPAAAPGADPLDAQS